MFSKEFMKYLSGTDAKSELKETKEETVQATNAMFYLILKSSGGAPKKVWYHLFSLFKYYIF